MARNRRSTTAPAVALLFVLGACGGLGTPAPQSPGQGASGPQPSATASAGATTPARTVASPEANGTTRSTTPMPSPSAGGLRGLPPLTDIPFYRADANGSLVNPGPGPEARPDVAWHTSFGASTVWPLLVSGLLIGGMSDGALVALDARTGVVRWRFAPPDGITQSIAAADGSIYVDGPATVYALDVQTGAQRWAAQVQAPFRGVVVDGVVYVAALGGAVGLSADHGATVWQWQGPPDAKSTVIRTADGVAYISAGDGRLYAVDVATRGERWHVQTISSNPGGAEIVGDTVYTGTVQGDAADPIGQLYAIDRASGVVRWVFRGPSNFQVNTGPVRDGVLYVNSMQDGIYALRDDGSAPTVLWHVDAPTSFFGLALVGDTLYQAGADGSVSAYAIANGQQQWETLALGAPSLGPLVSGGMIFTANNGQGMMAFADAGLIALLPRASPIPEPSAAPSASQPPDPFTILKTVPWAITGLATPLGLAVGPDGLVDILDITPSVTVIDPRTASVVRSWGQQGAGPGQFDLTRADDNPGFGGIAVAPDGRVYVADGSNHRVQVFEPDGTFVRQFGSFGTGLGELGSIESIVLGPDRSVYVLDASLNALSKFTEEGKFVWRLEASAFGSELPGLMHYPGVRPDGKVVITCEGCRGDRIIDPETGRIVGDFVPQFDDPEVSGTFDAAGNLFVATSETPERGYDLVFGPNGALVASRQGSGMAGGKLVRWGSMFWPAPEFDPDGHGYAFNEDGLLEIGVTLPR